MARLTFSTKPTDTTCRNAKRYLEEAGRERPVLITTTGPVRGFDKKAYTAAGIK